MLTVSRLSLLKKTPKNYFFYFSDLVHIWNNLNNTSIYKFKIAFCSSIYITSCIVSIAKFIAK